MSIVGQECVHLSHAETLRLRAADAFAIGDTSEAMRNLQLLMAELRSRGVTLDCLVMAYWLKHYLRERDMVTAGDIVRYGLDTRPGEYVLAADVELDLLIINSASRYNAWRATVDRVARHVRYTVLHLRTLIAHGRLVSGVLQANATDPEFIGLHNWKNSRDGKIPY